MDSEIYNAWLIDWIVNQIVYDCLFVANIYICIQSKKFLYSIKNIWNLRKYSYIQ